MAASLHALDFLSRKKPTEIPAVAVVFGDEVFLKRLAVQQIRGQVLGGSEDEFSLTVYSGSTAEPRGVFDELATVSMFGSARRVVIIEDADDFVTAHRSALERYVGHPHRTGVLVILAQRWPSNTKLAKAIAADFLAVECKTPTSAKLITWLVQWAQTRHNAVLEEDAAELIVEILGPEMGLLDQELAKLSAFAGGEPVTAATVEELVGGWRAKTAWEMLDHAAGGNAAEAIQQLDRLLAAGENAIAVLAQIGSSLRRFAAATRAIERAQANGRKISVRNALEEAGIKRFVLDKAESQLRQLGRQRAQQLYRWLLAADLDLKGGSTLPPRVILERLIVRLSAQLAPPSPAR